METREFAGFEPVPAKSGPKLNAPEAGDRSRTPRRGSPPSCPGISLPAATSRLGSVGNHATGPAGNYDFTLEFARDLPSLRRR